MTLEAVSGTVQGIGVNTVPHTLRATARFGPEFSIQALSARGSDFSSTSIQVLGRQRPVALGQQRCEIGALCDS